MIQPAWRRAELEAIWRAIEDGGSGRVEVFATLADAQAAGLPDGTLAVVLGA